MPLYGLEKRNTIFTCFLVSWLITVIVSVIIICQLLLMGGGIFILTSIIVIIFIGAVTATIFLGMELLIEHLIDKSMVNPYNH
jgi:hypothetical protein